jgi:hypothetical protein
VDEQFSIDAQEVWSSYRDFRVNLTGGDRISISVSVDGSVILFAIYNSTETYEALLLERRDVTSVNEEWTAPYKDKFDFYLKIYAGTAQVHFTVQKVGGGGGGFDPTVLIIVVVVAAVAVVASFLILRMRKGSAGPPPPPTPPPPPP